MSKHTPHSVSAKPQRVAHRGPLVTVIGRPNVGKSTLFNRLVQARQAITDDHPGVTRDRLYAEVEWDGRRFVLVDTGGYVPEARDSITAAITAQAETAIQEADLLLMVCDASTSYTDLDRRLADIVLRSGRPHLLVANKVDNAADEQWLGEFHGLGLGVPQPVSAATGRRSGDLLTEVVQRLDLQHGGEGTSQEDAIHVVLAGRPNVGKSTLVNRLAGELVSVVHETPGTTRDTTSVRLVWAGREIELTDTAGMRRRPKVQDPVEFYSNRRAADAIQRADVVLVLLDAVERWTVQDARIIGHAMDSGCGLVIAVNKWDQITGDARDRERFTADLHARFPFLQDFPLVFISALTGKRVHICLEWMQRIHERRRQRIPTARLNDFVSEMTRHHPPFGGGREVKVLYATQAGFAPPTFIFFVTRPDLVDRGYRRFAEKRLREQFQFQGTPIRTVWRARRGR